MAIVGGEYLEQFEVYFQMVDLDRDGRISGQEVVAFFPGSNLPRPVLAQMWMHADQNRTGFLSRPAFYNALKLVTVAQSKQELTHDIVKAALYGLASAKIPAPQINLAAISAPQPNPVAATMVGPHLPNSNNDWPGGKTSAASTGHPTQVLNRGNSPSTSAVALNLVNQLSTMSTSAAEDPKGLVGSGVKSTSNPMFGGEDTFSATQSPSQQVAFCSKYSAISLPTLSAIVPGISGPQPSAKPAPFEASENTLVDPSTSVQALLATPPLPKSNQQTPTRVTSSLSSSGVPASIGSPIQDVSWPEMTQASVQKYVKDFVEVDTDRDGKITWVQASNLFLSWNTPRDVLKQIWDLSDQDSDDMLNLREFRTALYLIERYREGGTLPYFSEVGRTSEIHEPFPDGLTPGISEIAAIWDEDLDKFEDEGFSFDVAVPENVNSASIQRENPSPTRIFSTDSVLHVDSTSKIPFSNVETDSIHSADESPSQEYSENHFRRSSGGNGETRRSFDEPTFGDFDNNDHIVRAFNAETSPSRHSSIGSSDPFFDSFSRYNSFSTHDHDRGSSPRFPSLDSIDSTRGFDHSSNFSFDDSDQFVSTAPFKVSSETTKQDSE